MERRVSLLLAVVTIGVVAAILGVAGWVLVVGPHVMSDRRPR